jgi:hypothetical protein
MTATSNIGEVYVRGTDESSGDANRRKRNAARVQVHAGGGMMRKILGVRDGIPSRA